MICKATAIDSIIKNGKTVGFKLKDSNGNIMDVNSEAIIKVMRANKIEIDNLVINSEGHLVIKKTEKEVEKTEKVSDSNKDRMLKLISVLNKARAVYEQGHDEIMTNAQYDALYDELVELEKETGITLSNSPTVNIGYEVVSELPKETHETTMMSLAKTKSVGDIKNFVGNKEAVLSWKLDGLTVVATYNKGLLVKAVTRGNGTVGELITQNYKQFINIPHKINYTGKLVVRGEAVITYTDFNKINAKLVDDDKYKNPRNLASGSVRQLDSRITAQRHVQFKAFTLVNTEDIGIKTVAESFKWLETQGFDVVQHVKVNSSNVETAIEKFTETAKEKKIDIPVDGLVITYNDIAYGKSLGCTAKTPRHSMALKWEDECVETRLREVEWSASKTGLLNPVAIFDPVDIEGSTVSRASVHNVSILADLELGYGDRLMVYKANMIIPQIQDNLDRTATVEIPNTCPVCGGPTEIRTDPNSGVYTLYCTNPGCPAKGNRLLKHFVSRDAMNIDGISGATLEKLGEYGIIDSFTSVFRLKNHPEIINIEGFGITSYKNMLKSVDKARNVKLANLIYAMSIPNVGLQTSKIICKHFNNDLKKTVTASYNELSNIDGVGDIIASSFYNWFHTKENIDEFVDLLSELNIVKEEVKQASTADPIYGKTFCVTGSVYIFNNRNQIKEIIESRGGKLTGSVSKSTNYLVTNDTSSGSRKNKAAAEYGIPVITEQQFIDMFNVSI